METQSIDLDPETIHRLEQVEQAITYWSRQYGKYSIGADQAKAQLTGVYNSREQLFNEIIRKSNLPDGARIVEISESGEVKVALPRISPSETSDSQ